MSKVQITIEMEINEDELKQMKSSKNNYEALTEDEYVDKMDWGFVHGKWTFVNPIEEYYNNHEGDARCIDNPKVISIKKI